MGKESQEIYLKLLRSGLRSEDLLKKMMDIGAMLSEKAQKESNTEFDVIACELFELVATLARGQGLKALAIKAQGFVDKATRINIENMQPPNNLSSDHSGPAVA